VTRTGFVYEDTDWEFVAEGENRGDTWLLATFSARVEGSDETREGLEVHAAIAWARRRADEVIVTLGDGSLWDPGQPLVRRRPPSERWKDRSPMTRRWPSRSRSP